MDVQIRRVWITVDVPKRQKHNSDINFILSDTNCYTYIKPELYFGVSWVYICKSYLKLSLHQKLFWNLLCALGKNIHWLKMPYLWEIRNEAKALISERQRSCHVFVKLIKNLCNVRLLHYLVVSVYVFLLYFCSVVGLESNITFTQITVVEELLGFFYFLSTFGNPYFYF